MDIGGPLRSPVGGDGIVFHQDASQGNRTRATMKAINAAPIHPSSTLAPTDGDGFVLRVMPMRADQSAVSAINRLLLMAG